jgi:mannose-6-phosphate isomerase-like protein (cupin superfamily)
VVGGSFFPSAVGFVVEEDMSSFCALCRHAGEGRNFPWKSDNAFVKVSSAESNGAFTLIEGTVQYSNGSSLLLCVLSGFRTERPLLLFLSRLFSSHLLCLSSDNITTEFHLPRHCHLVHTETFYIITGRVEFILDDRIEILTPGDTLHVPRGESCRLCCLLPDTSLSSLFSLDLSLCSPTGVPHEVRGLDATTKMLTFYEPGGLEYLFEAYEQMDPADFSDAEKMKIIEAKFDSIMLGPKETVGVAVEAEASL